MQELTARLQSALGDTYRIERELGGGGMSRVFVAEETALGRQVVVKVLPPELAAASTPSASGARSSSPRRCSIRTSCRCSPRARRTACSYYTMPFVEGESLRARLAREGELPVGEAIAHAARRRATRSPTRTRAASCTATSSPTTCCSPAARAWSPTSASPRR